MPISAEVPSADTRDRLLACGVATLHEVMGRRGLAGGIGLLVGTPFAGPAATVSLPAGDNLGIHALLRDAPADAVLCIASLGRGDYGVIGELIVTAARRRGVAGLVIDDGIRDIGALAPPPSIAARGVTAQGTVKRRHLGLQRPVALAGMLVRPADWIVADADGVCCVPEAELPHVLVAASARTAREDGIRDALLDGRTTVEILELGALLDDEEGTA